MNLMGTGALWCTPTFDINGAALMSPTPFQFGVLQEWSIDASFDQKLLFGQGSFAVDAGRARGKVMFKAKFTQINVLPLNAAFFGMPVGAGLVHCANDQIGRPAAASVAVTIPSGGVYFANLGVRDQFGVPFTRVLSAPVAGQYTANGSGTYVFAAADFGKIVLIDYSYTQAASGRSFVVTNTNTGVNPLLSLDCSVMRNGKTLTLNVPRVISAKLAMGFKPEDYTMPDMEFQAIADDTGTIMRGWVTE